MSIQQKIIEALGSKPSIDPAVELERRISFLVDYALTWPGNRGFVLGISGGQDSSLAGKIAQLAVERLRAEGRDTEFFAVRLPYGTQRDEDDAQLALSFISPDNVLTVDVADSVDALAASVATATGEPVTDFNRGNIKARMRMAAQYAIAGDRHLLVIGTDHAAEAVTGFFTKFGDGAADVLPLSGLTKGQGAELLQELGAPPRLWEKIPTADLLDDAPEQSDESSLGLSYREIDSYLRGEEVPPRVEETIEDRYSLTAHKRNHPVGPSDSWWKNS